MKLSFRDCTNVQMLLGREVCVCVSFTLVRIRAKQRVLAPKADAESPASRGSALGVGNLHEVDVAVGGNKVHAAQWVRANAGLPEGGPHLVPQLQGKLDERRETLWGTRHRHICEYVCQYL